MSRKKLDIIGQKYGRLTVIADAEYQKGKRILKCRCDCGEICFIVMNNIRSGRTKSCGCLRSKQAITRRLKHGESRTNLYKVWRAMVNRSCNSNYYQFAQYGANGVGICDEWKEDFYAFKQWAYENGYRTDCFCSIRRRHLWDGFHPDNCYIKVCDKSLSNTK